MKPLFLKYIFPVLLVFTISACVAPEKDMQADNTDNREYIVQFEQETDRKNIETVLNNHGISKFSYLNSSRQRGYIVLIKIADKNRDILKSLKKEECVKNISPNYRRKIYGQ